MKNYLKQKRWQTGAVQPFYRFLWATYNLYRFVRHYWTFHHSLSKDFEAATDFDAVFCLAVFQRAENRHDQTRQESDLMNSH